MVSDQGKDFKNRLIDNRCYKNGVGGIYTIPYDHGSNGLMERSNQIVIRQLRKESSQQRGEDLVHKVESMLRNVIFSFHNDLRRMPVEVWHGSLQV